MSDYKTDDAVCIKTGPFANFVGRVAEVDAASATLKVVVNIFGRATPVELTFDDVDKSDEANSNLFPSLPSNN